MFGIGSTGREWRFYRLHNSPEGEQVGVAEQQNFVPHGEASKKHKDHSPLSIFMGTINYESDENEMDIDTEGTIEEITERKLMATKVYKWDDPAMLYSLGSILKQMTTSRRRHISSISASSLNDRVMWHLVKVDDLQPWGWSKLNAKKIHWRRMINRNTRNVVVLAMLGRGADGKVLLVANNKGEVAALKLVKIEKPIAGMYCCFINHRKHLCGRCRSG